MASAIQVEGVRETRAALRRVADGAKDLREAHGRAARTVEQAASPRVRRKSGRLAASLRSSGQVRLGVVRLGFAAIPYAGVQEFGWPAHNITPMHALVGAVESSEQRVVTEFERGIAALAKKNGLA